jgi:TPR repeat protein
MRYSTIKIGLMIGLMHILSTSSFSAKTSIPSIQSFSVEGCTTCKADTTEVPDEKNIECVKQFEHLKYLASIVSESSSVAEERMKVEAKISVGLAYYNGSFSYNGNTISITQDWWKASSYLNTVADINHYEPGYLICGLMYGAGGAGIKKDNKIAIKHYQKFINLYDHYDDHLLDLAYGRLARCYKEEGDTLMFTRILKEGYEKGFISVCYDLGDCYASGIGMTQSYADAFKVFQKGLKGSNEEEVLLCKFRLALLYGNGKGCDKDLVKYKALLEEVAQKGAMQLIAKYILAKDEYNQANYTKAFAYCNEIYNSKSENWEDVRGAVCTMLAKMYQFGRGVEANQTEAEKWWKEAAECGDTDATKVQKWLHSN